VAFFIIIIPVGIIPVGIPFLPGLGIPFLHGMAQSFQHRLRHQTSKILDFLGMGEGRKRNQNQRKNEFESHNSLAF